MVTAWRALFRRPDAYFGFVQLSTWCTSNATNASIAQMRDAQLAALALPKVGGATPTTVAHRLRASRADFARAPLHLRRPVPRHLPPLPPPPVPTSRALPLTSAAPFPVTCHRCHLLP